MSARQRHKRVAGVFAELLGDVKLGKKLESRVRARFSENYDTSVRYAADYIDGLELDGSFDVLNAVVDAIDKSLLCPRELQFRERIKQKEEREESALHRLQELGGAANVAALRCRRCKGTKIGCQMKQTRSMDEGMIAYYTCGDCGAKWNT